MPEATEWMKSKDPETEKALMQDPDDWPCWPMLPVKRYSTKEGSWPETGLMIAKSNVAGGVEPTVYMLNLFGEHTIKEFIECKKHKYESLDALVDDGWIVD